MKNIYLASLLTIFFSLAIYPQTKAGFKQESPEEFPSLKAFLKAKMKKKDKILEQSRGDLNQDGIADWAGIIYFKVEDFLSSYKLYVLLGKRNGGYQLATTTGNIEKGGMGCCWIDKMEIKNSSVYISNVAKSVRDSKTSTHQFKLSNGEWRLIGLKIVYVDLGEEEEIHETTDMNFLTGKVIEKYKKGKRKPTTEISQKKFGIYFLKDFDFEVDFGTEREKEDENL